MKLEIWQANGAGRYTHPHDRNPAAIDPNFDGYATVMTDSEGRYRFRTVKPGAYPVVADYWRPPHIHYDITGKVNRLITGDVLSGRAAEQERPAAATIGTRTISLRKCYRRRQAKSRIQKSWSGTLF